MRWGEVGCTVYLSNESIDEAFNALSCFKIKFLIYWRNLNGERLRNDGDIHDTSRVKNVGSD